MDQQPNYPLPNTSEPNPPPNYPPPTYMPPYGNPPYNSPPNEPSPNPPYNNPAPNYPPPTYMTPSGPWITTGTGQQAYLAGPGARLGARILDGLIVIAVAVVAFVLALIVAAGVGAVTAGVGGVLIVWLALFIILAGALAYEVVLTATKGQTLGKQAVGIKVVRIDNGQIPGWGPAFKRWGLPALLGLVGVSLLCYLSLLWGDNRQGWHDKVAETYVIKT